MVWEVYLARMPEKRPVVSTVAKPVRSLPDTEYGTESDSPRGPTICMCASRVWYTTRRDMARVIGKVHVMSMYEERLSSVERDLRQFKTDSVKSYGNMAHETGIVRGLIEDVIGRMTTLSATTERRFERMHIRLDGMDAHLEYMDKRLEGVNARLDGVDTHLERLDKRVDDVNGHLERLDKRGDRVETTLSGHTTRLDRLETRIDRLETTLGEHTSLLTQILARLPEKP